MWKFLRLACNVREAKVIRALLTGLRHVLDGKGRILRAALGSSANNEQVERAGGGCSSHQNGRSSIRGIGVLP